MQLLPTWQAQLNNYSNDDKICFLGNIWQDQEFFFLPCPNSEMSWRTFELDFGNS